MAQTATKDTTPTTEPAWFSNLLVKYGDSVAHTFLLSDNIGDYVDNTNTLKTYIATRFSSRDVVLFYNRARGIEFPLPEYRQTAIKYLGLDQKTQDPAQSDNMFAALRTQGVGGAPGPTEAAIDDGSPAEALATIEALMRATKPDGSPVRVVAIIDYVEQLVPQSVGGPLPPEDRHCLITLQEWAKDKQIAESNAMILLVTDSIASVHPDIRSIGSKIEHIRLPWPDLNERVEYVAHLQDPEKTDPPLELARGFTAQMLANMTAGLRKLEIEDIYLRSFNAKEPVTAKMVLDRKEEIIRQEYQEVIEMPPLFYGFETFPFPAYIHDWLMPNVIDNLRSGDTQGTPKGIMWVGPPGTGKSVRVMAMAKEAGVNFVKLNLGKTKGRYVGESEEKLEKALNAIFSNVPTMVFVDEADQAFPQNREAGGDSGVTQNILGRIMQVMAEPQWEGRVLWNFASNRPDLIDPALQREGRIDKIIPILPPENDAERIDVMKNVAKRVNYPMELTDEDFEAVAPKLAGRTQAQIEGLMKKAFEVARRTDRVIRRETMEHAIRVLRPSMADTRLMTLQALKYCNDLELLPPSMWDVRADEEQMSEEIEQLEEREERKLTPARRRGREID